jgi:ATP-binding cassette subfamily B protein
MTTPEHSRGSPARKRAVLLALGCYGRQMARLRRFTVPAMLLPALGTRAFTASRR